MELVFTISWEYNISVSKEMIINCRQFSQDHFTTNSKLIKPYMNTKTLKPSAYLREVIKNSEKELAEDEIKFHKGSTAFLRSLKV